MIVPEVKRTTNAEVRYTQMARGAETGGLSLGLSPDSATPLPHAAADEELFERWAWLYALCRERIFTSHASLVERVMRRCTTGAQDWAPVFVEVGCGPGFYSRLMAQKFPGWRVIGIDRSKRLLQLARRKAASRHLTNCEFYHGDINCADYLHQQADLLLASRLLFILADRRKALETMYKSLSPGGSLLLAEPVAGFRSSIALSMMRVLSSLSLQYRRPDFVPLDSEDQHPRAISPGEFSDLVNGQVWAHVEVWRDGRYQYALCEKPISACSLTRVPGRLALVR